MQAPRTSTKVVDAMDCAIDRLRAAYRDRTLDASEFDDVMDALMDAVYLAGKADAQLSIGMVALKSGPDSTRYKQVERDYRRTYANNVIEFPHTKKHPADGIPPGAA